MSRITDELFVIETTSNALKILSSPQVRDSVSLVDLEVFERVAKEIREKSKERLIQLRNEIKSQFTEDLRGFLKPAVLADIKETLNAFEVSQENDEL